MRTGLRMEYRPDYFDDVFLEAHRVLGKQELFRFLYEDVHLTIRWVSFLFRISPNTMNSWLGRGWGSRLSRGTGFTHYQNHMGEEAIKAWLIPQIMRKMQEVTGVVFNPPALQRMRRQVIGLNISQRKSERRREK